MPPDGSPKTQMKILQVVRQYLPGTGGMETYVSSLCRELSARGHRVDVATLDYIFKTGERLPSYERIDDIDVIRLPSWGNPRYFVAPRLLELIGRYDLIHVHGVDFFIDMLGFGKKAHGKPVVLSTHGGFFHTDWFPSFKRAFFHTATRRALKGVDQVIADSPHDEKLFAHISDRVTLVDNGVDVGRFASVVKKPVVDTLLFIGRISRNKRVDRLLEALAVLRSSRPDARLVVVGPDWEGLLGGLKKQAEALGLADAVTFTGAVPLERLREELAAARLFVSASEYEAFGISTVEAMASGTVPVVNRIDAFVDIIDEGDTGFTCDFSQAQAAAAILKRVLELPDDQLAAIGERARKSAGQYDWPRVADHIVRIYEEVLRGRL